MIFNISFFFKAFLFAVLSPLKYRTIGTDPVGPGRGPEICSKNYTYYGSYAARIRIPDVREVQPNAGAVVGYFTYNMEKEKGLSEIDWEWLIADPEIVYIGTWTGKQNKPFPIP